MLALGGDRADLMGEGGDRATHNARLGDDELRSVVDYRTDWMGEGCDLRTIEHSNAHRNFSYQLMAQTIND
jgi:hypothetical protein